MGVMPKAVGVLSCGFLVCLGLSYAAQANTAASATEGMKPDGQADQNDMTLQRQSRVIQGDVLRMEEGHYVVKQKDGKEVRVATDPTTKIMRQIKNGDRIVANVDDQNRTLWITAVP
jgi:hypothetical protein